jgi:hypothetical protein
MIERLYAINSSGTEYSNTYKYLPIEKAEKIFKLLESPLFIAILLVLDFEVDSVEDIKKKMKNKEVKLLISCGIEYTADRANGGKKTQLRYLQASEKNIIASDITFQIIKAYKTELLQIELQDIEENEKILLRNKAYARGVMRIMLLNYKNSLTKILNLTYIIFGIEFKIGNSKKKKIYLDKVVEELLMPFLTDNAEKSMALTIQNQLNDKFAIGETSLTTALCDALKKVGATNKVQ